MTRRGEKLARRTQALESALEAGEGWLDSEVLARGAQAAVHARGRLRLSVDHTVVSLAGSTGSGKSTIFNALAGREISSPGTRRPTTSRAMAAVWDTPSAGVVEPLLDWLEVDQRTFVESSEDRAGLVLLDLPDHDSVVVEHRVRAERIVERADLLVWVMDPQKYADAAVHERYLRGLAGHSDVVVVVLNQIDRLAPSDQEQCLADLRRLVRQDGLTSAVVLGVSAVTGQGMGELHELVARAARDRAAATDRLLADVRAAASDVLAECGTSHGGAHPLEAVRAELLESLGRAARADVVVDAVRGSALLRARAATGWPVTRWVGRFRADPLRRLNLHRREVHTELARSSLPPADAAMGARTRRAVRSYVDAASIGAPTGWVLMTRERLRDDDLPDALDQAVARTEVDGGRRPRWWAVMSVVQWVLLGVLLAGLLWLAGLAVLAYAQLPVPASPEVEGFPIPTLMVVGGLLSGVFLALVARLLALVGANRAARRAARRLGAEIELVANEAVVGPVRTQRRLLDECRSAAALASR